MKKNVAIVFGITSNLAFALANVLIGMKKHCKPIWDDIIVYNDGLDEDVKTLLNSIVPCKFVQYDEKSISGTVDAGRLKSYSLLTLARFECFQLLEDYHKVIWHDVDILVQKDFSGLLLYGNESGLALTCDPTFSVEQNFYGLMPGYNLLMPLYNAGMMVVSDKLKKHEELTKYCYETFNKNNEKLRYMDQSVYNMMIQDYKIDVEEIDIKMYCCHPSRAEYKSAAIVHAYGADKFWNSEKMEKQFPEWHRNNEIWEAGLRQKNLMTRGIKTRCIENPKISVIMSVFERTEYLDEAVNSILEQTYTDFEFIIVVEKSNVQQQISAKLKSYKDDRIIIICNEEKLGFASSLNVGLDAAKGEFIARMDDDDISLPDRFEKQIAYLEKNTNISVVGTFMKMFMKSTEECISPTSNDELRIKALTENPLFHPTVMMRKKDLEKYGLRYDPKHFAEDYELWSRVMEHLQIANIPEFLHLFRASGQNATSTKQQKVLNSHLTIMQQLFRKNLNLEFSYDEMLILRSPSVANSCYNSGDFIRMRDEVIKKTIEANYKRKAYDHEQLMNYFGTLVDFSFKARMKNALSGYPILFSLVKKCYHLTKRSDAGSERSKQTEKQNKADSILKRIKMRTCPPSSRSFHNAIQEICRVMYSQNVDIVDMKYSINECTKLIMALQGSLVENEQNIIDSITQKASVMAQQLTAERISSSDQLLSQVRNQMSVQTESLDEVHNQMAIQNESLNEVHNQMTLQNKSVGELNDSIKAQENTFGAVFAKMTESERWIVKELRAGFYNNQFELEKSNVIRRGLSKNKVYDDLFYRSNRYGSVTSAAFILKNIISGFNINSVVDFGCGTGTWLHVAKALGVKNVLGIDGDYVDREKLMIEETEFMPMDLELAIDLPNRYDMAISMEVGEHLREVCADDFVKSICLSADIVLFSAAHEGQGGDHHINCQPHSYWREKFEKNGYHHIEIRPLFKDNWEIESWYRENVSLYVSNNRFMEIENIKFLISADTK